MNSRPDRRPTALSRRPARHLVARVFIELGHLLDGNFDVERELLFFAGVDDGGWGGGSREWGVGAGSIGFFFCSSPTSPPPAPRSRQIPPHFRQRILRRRQPDP